MFNELEKIDVATMMKNNELELLQKDLDDANKLITKLNIENKKMSDEIDNWINCYGSYEFECHDGSSDECIGLESSCTAMVSWSEFDKCPKCVEKNSVKRKKYN